MRLFPALAVAAFALLVFAAPARGQEQVLEVPVDRVVAVVGDRAILWSDVLERINQRRAQGLQLPTDSAALNTLVLETLNGIVDEEVLVQQARADNVEITDAEVSAMVDQQIREVRSRFSSEAEFRQRLAAAGLGSPEQYRLSLMEQARRALLQRQLIAKLRQDGKLIPVAVSEADINRAFEENRESFPRRPATVAFRQIVVAPAPSEEAKRIARAKAESLLAEIRAGADFEQIARRESMDPGSKDQGGDLGWNRRGQMVPEFDFWMFRLRPGQVSPIVETVFGYHIIRVDRVQPAEVKARHILIRPAIAQADIDVARARADTVATLWRAGTPFDTLVARYHDPSEDKIIPPFERAQLPEAYSRAFEGKGVGDITDPFAIPAPDGGPPKFGVARITEAAEEGEYTLADLRERIRDSLSEERAFRRLIDSLRDRTYVSIRL